MNSIEFYRRRLLGEFFAVTCAAYGEPNDGEWMSYSVKFKMVNGDIYIDDERLEVDYLKELDEDEE